ncbi:ceramide galactosyltransferase UGT [Acrasis kona]|uniref:Ceramide galactosyltransferase UGT n=1 Tax=Acrasis kona TaxID=1008807 RepID=A0AAW2Z2X0_9EUKA
MINKIIAVLFFVLLYFTQAKEVLVVAPGLGGHIRPNFDLVKKLSTRGHQVTLLTESLALRYINTTGVNIKELILTDTSSGALERELINDSNLNSHVANITNLMDGIIHFFSNRSEMELSFYKKISELMQKQKYDLMMVDFSAFTVRPLIFPNNTPCAISWGTYIASTDVPDINVVALTNPLNSGIFNTFFGRIHNILRSVTFTFSIAKYVLGLFSRINQDVTIPETFRSLANVANFNAATDRCMSIIAVPPAMNPERYRNYQHRFVGTFMDLSEVTKPQQVEHWIEHWLTSHKSVIFAALGTTTFLSEERMKSFLLGLDYFLTRESNKNASVFLALSHQNYVLFQQVSLQMKNLNKLIVSDRIKVVSDFVPQRAILQHESVKVFISHGGTGSVMESLLYGKPILNMPYHFDHHYTSIKVQELNAGLSLFSWEPTFVDLFIEREHVKYVFTAEDVSEKLSLLLHDNKFTKGAKSLSREIMYGGGAERAVYEMEYLMDMGNLDYQRPLYMDYPFYSRYYLDFILVVVVIMYLSFKMINVLF